MPNGSSNAPITTPPPGDLTHDEIVWLSDAFIKTFDEPVFDLVHRARALGILFSRLLDDYEELYTALRVFLAPHMADRNNGGDLFNDVIAETAVQDVVDVLDGLCKRIMKATAGAPVDEQAALRKLDKQMRDHLEEIGEPLLFGSVQEVPRQITGQRITGIEERLDRLQEKLSRALPTTGDEG